MAAWWSTFLTVHGPKSETHPVRPTLCPRFAQDASTHEGLRCPLPPRRVYLCLFAGTVGVLPQAKTAGPEMQGAAFTGKEKHRRRRGKDHKASFKSRDWILKKKESRRRRDGSGEVRKDTRYTGRSRKMGW